MATYAANHGGILSLEAKISVPDNANGGFIDPDFDMFVSGLEGITDRILLINNTRIHVVKGVSFIGFIKRYLFIIYMPLQVWLF